VLLDLISRTSTLTHCVLLIILCFSSCFISFTPISFDLLLPTSDYVYRHPHSFTYPYPISIEPDITPSTPFYSTLATGTDIPGLCTFRSFKFPASSYILVLVWLFPDHTASLDVSTVGAGLVGTRVQLSGAGSVISRSAGAGVMGLRPISALTSPTQSKCTGPCSTGSTFVRFGGVGLGSTGMGSVGEW
jgi:hypothetical protein